MKKYTLLLAIALTPIFAYAQSVDGFLSSIRGYVEALIPIAIGISFLVFVMGVVRFIWNADNEEKRKDGKQQLLWGVIAIFVVFAIWGIVAVVGGTLNIGIGGSVTPPVVDCDFLTSLGETCPSSN